jgi:hypothetical protein
MIMIKELEQWLLNDWQINQFISQSIYHLVAQKGEAHS